ncbi:apolipoprotein acyltransferase [Mesobacterium sp. TK19101]|uniref:Apolipoprotein acyltransferase n=1 Tax=Mesobacterium hydrothermale TaxID=3111907 RepID=A0ABU6HDR5_9RHOB|nr:apolipoprotein acyltransferase [Mesobacterium sp. TK19101]MEC3860595.1 apolipoprotein acyltransferase [Mesobacterium sp. TK19101]
MIVILSALLGAAIGALTAKRRKGNLADIAQFAAGYGMAFAILGLIATIFLEKTL